MTAPTTSTTQLRGLKMAKPEKFDGSKREEATPFIVSCRMYLEAAAPGATEEQAVRFIISYLDGSPKAWVQPFLEQEMLQNQRVAWLHSLTDFLSEFMARFGEANRDENARVKLKKLKHTGTVQDYLTGFQTHSASLGYNDVVLRDMFYDGLNQEIREDMLAQDFEPAGNTTFLEIAERALRIDRRRQLHKHEKSKSSSNTPTNKTTSFASASSASNSQPPRDRLSKGDSVYMLQADGKAKKGKITDISKNSKGIATPSVTWNSEKTPVQIPFNTIRRDNRPAPAPSPFSQMPSPPKDPKGPGPMDIDTAGGKAKIVCHMCGGKGHFAKECPSRALSVL
jgi:hypothetical protein